MGRLLPALISIGLLLGACPAIAQVSVSIDHVDGVAAGDTVVAPGADVRWVIRMENGSANSFGVSNGFRVYSPDGATWSGTIGDTIGWRSTDPTPGLALFGRADFDLPFSILSASCDGSGSDTVGFIGPRIMASGLSAGFADTTYSISASVISQSSVGLHVCIDSSWFAPGGTWKWWAQGSVTEYPSWSGSQCFVIRDEPRIVITPTQMTFTAQVGDPDPVTRFIRIEEVSSVGPAPTFAASTSAPWLNIANVSGTLPNAIGVWPTISRVSPGTYVDSIRFDTDPVLNSPVWARVTLVLSPDDPVFQQIALEKVDAVTKGDTIYSGQDARFILRVTNDTTLGFSFSSGFRVYSPDGATWDSTKGDTLGWRPGDPTPGTAILSKANFDLQYVINSFSSDGAGADTIGFIGAKVSYFGLPAHFDDTAWSVTAHFLSPLSAGLHICIDSAWFRPGGTWKWVASGGINRVPLWSGPHCFAIGDAVPQPDIEISPTALSADLLSGELEQQAVTISNVGGSNLKWSAALQLLAEPGVPATVAGESSALDIEEAPTLESVLGSLSVAFRQVTSVIPSRYDFSEGETGEAISDGGDNMYEGGNILWTTSSTEHIQYTDAALVSSSQYFGTGGRYFTAKFPGLFVLAADLNGISAFAMGGYLGNAGTAELDARVLQVTLDDRVYQGFVKRAYGAATPSVNHVVIIERNPSASHTWSSNSGIDYHSVYGMAGTTRLYYLLFAGADGTYIDDNAIITIMTKFLTIVNGGSAWISLNPSSGTVLPSEQQVLTARFNSTRLWEGDYYAEIELTSNDFDEPTAVIPVHLHVTGAPDIEVDSTTLTFPRIYTTKTFTDSIRIISAGTMDLSVSGMTTDNPVFSVDPVALPLTLPPGDETYVRIHFTPTDSGPVEGHLTIESNDQDETRVQILLLGAGSFAPELTVSADSMSIRVNQLDSTSSPFTIGNVGLGELSWRVTGLFTRPSESYTLPEVTISPSRPDSAVGPKTLFELESAAKGVTARQITGEYARLDGVRFGFFYSSAYSILASDLRARGATVSDLAVPLSDEKLRNLDVVAVDYGAYYLSESDIAAIRNRLATGGALLLQGPLDGDEAYVRSLVEGSGITAVAGATQYFGSAVTIVPHAITSDVQSVYVGGYYSAEVTASDPAEGVLLGANNRIILATGQLNAGRIIVVINRLMCNELQAYDDNRILCNQACDWLARGNTFLSIDRDTGTVAPNATQEVTVFCSAAALMGGDFRHVMTLLSNDSANSPRRIPINVHVVGIPNIVVPTDTTAFGDVFVAFQRTDSIDIVNDGSDSLAIDQISAPAGFTVAPATLSIPRYGHGIVHITFNPDAPGLYEGDIEIHSNDPDQPLAYHHVAGTGLLPPQVALAPSLISHYLVPAGRGSRVLTVANNGASDLTFTMTSRTPDPVVPNFAGIQTETDELPKIAVVGTLGASTTVRNDIVGLLTGSGYFSQVDAVDGSFSNFTYASLRDYDAIVVYSLDYWYSSTAAGNAIAEYVDSGGNVLISCLANADWDTELTGRFQSGGYYLIPPYDAQYGSGYSLGTIDVPEHEIMSGISAVRTRLKLEAGASVVADATVLAHFADGTPAIAVRENGGQRRIDLAFPIWRADTWYGIDSTSDADELVVNAVRWLAFGGVSWIDLQPQTGIVPAGQSAAITVTFDAENLAYGDYEADIICSSNDPYTPEARIRTVLTVGPAAIPTDQWITVYCANPTINGVPIPVGTPLKIFDLDGALCGMDTVDAAGFGATSVYLDDPLSEVDEGPLPGEPIFFQFGGEGVWSEPEVRWTSNGDRFEVCEFQTHRCLPLHAGWNLVSWNSIVTDDTLEHVAAGVLDHTSIIMGFEKAGLTYYPDLPQFATLHQLDYLHGYWFRMAEEDTLCVNGPWAPLTTPIPLESGWNLVGYLPEKSRTVSDALSSVYADVQMVYGFAFGAQIYDPALLDFNTLDSMRNGYGYWIRVLKADTLRYNDEPREASEKTLPSSQGMAESVESVSPTTQWINLFSRRVTLDGSPVAPGTTITARDQGTGAIVGSGRIDAQGILPLTPVYGRNGTEGPGVAPGAQFVIEVDGRQTADLLTWTRSGERIELTTLASGKGAGDESLPRDWALTQNNPNPFNPSTRISFDVPASSRVTLRVYNFLGQQVRTLVDAHLAPGTHVVEWDAKGPDGQPVASGVYLYRLVSGEFKQTRKMILLR